MREPTRSRSPSHAEFVPTFVSTRGRLRARARAVAPPTATRATHAAPSAKTAAATRAALPAFVPELDGLRGLAIALVFLVHAEGIVEWGRPLDASGAFGWLRTLFHGGHTGVSLFFVLSGFLVARPFVAALADGRPPRLAHYALRRFWRIAPLYVLAVVATTTFMARTSADLWRGVPYLFFLGPFLPRADRLAPIVTSVWWSLSTEVQFYLLLPLVLLAFRGPRGGRRGAIVLATLAAIYACAVARVLPLTNDQYWRIYQSVIGRGPLFAYGALAAWLCERHGTRIRAWVTGRRGARVTADAAVVLAAAALLALLTSVVRAFDYVTLEQTHPTWHLAEGALWTSIVLVCVAVPCRATAVFRSRALQHLGRISYSVYLLHQPVLFAAFYTVRLQAPGTLPAAWQPLTIALTVAVAAVVVALGHLAWLTVERPLSWQRPVPRDPQRDAVAAPVTLVQSAAAPQGGVGLGTGLGNRRAIPCHMRSAQRA